MPQAWFQLSPVGWAATGMLRVLVELWPNRGHESRLSPVVRVALDYSRRPRRVEGSAFIHPVRNLRGVFSRHRATSPEESLERLPESHDVKLRNGTADTMRPDTSAPEGAAKTKRSSGYFPKIAIPSGDVGG